MAYLEKVIGIGDAESPSTSFPVGAVSIIKT